MTTAIDAGCLMLLRLLQGLRRCVVLADGGTASHACCCRDGRAPIHRSAQQGDLSCVEFLVARGADVHAQDE